MAPIIEPQGPPEAGERPPSLAARLAWFFGLALVSAAAVAVVAEAMRWLIVRS